MKFSPVFLSTLLLFGCAAPSVHSEADLGTPLRADPEVASRLVSLVDERKLLRLTPDDFQLTALKDVITLTTPAGYRIKNRVLELGVPLADALSLSKDRQLRNRLIEAARWANSPRSRAQALLGLAGLRDPEHLKFFREALVDTDVSVQFAALEALQTLGTPEAQAYFMDAANRGWYPVIKVYAAQAALRMGDARGRDKLLEFLRDQNWLMRAMAARYLGELGRPEDGDMLLSRIGPEQGNKFVLAEVCIAALKLTSRRGGSAPPQVAASLPAPSPAASVPRRGAFELEPLVITAPRLRFASTQTVDVRIDNDLVRLLQQLDRDPTPDQQILDPALQDVNKLVTPTGFGLKIRYSDISFLLTEGLAGTHDFSLLQRVESLARDNPNTRIRAAALISLAYDRERKDIFIFQQALRDPSVIVRFGAVEALGIVNAPQARNALADAAQSDRSPVVRVFAAQALRRAGDSYGREILLRFLDDQDWVVRSLAMNFLGELGLPEDYERVAFKLGSETSNYGIAEGCLALLRLSTRTN